MPKKLPVNGFEYVEDLSQFKEDLWNYDDEDSNKEYFLKVDVEYRKILFNLHNDLPFLSERNKIKKCNKLFCNVHDKKNCCSHKGFKTSTKWCINTKKVHRVIQFNLKAWLKPYIDMNTNLRTESKNHFEKYLFKLWIILFSEKQWRM